MFLILVLRGFGIQSQILAISNTVQRPVMIISFNHLHFYASAADRLFSVASGVIHVLAGNPDVAA